MTSMVIITDMTIDPALSLEPEIEIIVKFMKINIKSTSRIAVLIVMIIWNVSEFGLTRIPANTILIGLSWLKFYQLILGSRQEEFKIILSVYLGAVIDH